MGDRDSAEPEVNHHALATFGRVVLSSTCSFQFWACCFEQAADSSDRDCLDLLHVYSLKLPLCVAFALALLQGTFDRY